MTTSIRLATANDAAQILAIYGPFCYTPVSFEIEPPSLEDMRQRVESVNEKYPWLVCDDGGRVLAYAYASLHRARVAYQWSVEVSVYVAEGCRRRGIGRALYASLFPLLSLQGFVNAYAGITLPNPASVGMHESLAFTPIGVYRRIGYKNGAWHDIGWWERELRGHTANPPAPAAPGVFQGSEAWSKAMAAGLELLRSDD